MDASFEHDESLRDGRLARLRFIRPSDSERLRRGYDRLSMESRHGRFFTALPALSDSLVHYLTAVDGVDHVAIVAVPPPEGEESVPGYGVGRFVRSRDDRTTAEVAITVADEVQGNGLGSKLLRSLAAAASERGIRTFTMVVLSENRRALAALRHVGARRVRSEGSAGTWVVPTAELALPSA